METLTHEISIWSDGEIDVIENEPTIPADKWWVVPDGLNGQPLREAAVKKGGTPCVFQTGEFGRHIGTGLPAPITRDWQFFNADLMALAVYNKLFLDLNREEKADIVTAFTGTFGTSTAFCNHKGFGDGHINYVKGEDLDGELPLMFPLICGTDTVYGHVEGDYLAVASWDYRESPPAITNRDILNDPRVRYATVVRNVNIGDGGYQVGKFPRLEGAYGVPYAFITTRQWYYPILRGYLQGYTRARRGLYWPEKDWPYY